MFLCGYFYYMFIFLFSILQNKESHSYEESQTEHVAFSKGSNESYINLMQEFDDPFKADDIRKFCLNKKRFFDDCWALYNKVRGLLEPCRL